MDRATDTAERPLESYRSYLGLIARAHLGPRLQAKLDANDVVQQAILHAHQHRGQFQGRTEGEWLAWLRAILPNALAAAARQFDTRARDLGRERSLEAELAGSPSRQECLLAAEQSSPSERAARSEEGRRLASGLARLADDQRKVVELHYLHAMPMAEVAARLGRTRPAVVGLLVRGLKALREHLRAAGGPKHDH